MSTHTHQSLAREGHVYYWVERSRPDYIIMSLVKVLLIAFVIYGVAEGADNGPEQIHLSSTGQLVVYIERVLSF